MKKTNLYVKIRNSTPDFHTFLEKAAKTLPVVSILGPRQSGKTTLVKQTFPNKPYVNLEAIHIRELATNDPVAFLDQYPEGAILDEIQEVPKLLSYIHK